MASPEKTPETWASLLSPDDAVRGWAHPGSTSLVAIGTAWDTVDAGWEALVIAPLERGLWALDELDLPRDGNHPVIADHSRSELIVLVPATTAARAVIGGPPGVRALAGGSYLLVPNGPNGALAASWLSRPTYRQARYVDPVRLCEAVLTAEARREEHARAN